MVIEHWDFQFGVGIETANCCQMNITTENADANGEFRGKGLELVNKKGALLFVSSRRVVIVQIIQQIYVSIK